MPSRAPTLARFAGSAAVVAAMTIPSSAHGQESDADSSLTQTEIARLLVSPRPGEVGRGIMQLGMPRGGIRLPGIPPEEWGSELRAAIVRAVEQKAWLAAPDGWGGLDVERTRPFWSSGRRAIRPPSGRWPASECLGCPYSTRADGGGHRRL